jgi:ArsR family transcriptional regulator
MSKLVLDKVSVLEYNTCVFLHILPRKLSADMDGFKQQAQLFRALSHPVRLRILDILARQETCVCHLTAALKRSQPYVSQQLATLREAGVVADRREGTLIYYRLAVPDIAGWLDRSKVLVEDEDGEALSFPPVPEVLPNCPCPRCTDRSTTEAQSF